MNGKCETFNNRKSNNRNNDNDIIKMMVIMMTTVMIMMIIRIIGMKVIMILKNGISTIITTGNYKLIPMTTSTTATILYILVTKKNL